MLDAFVVLVCEPHRIDDFLDDQRRETHGAHLERAPYAVHRTSVTVTA